MHERMTCCSAVWIQWHIVLETLTDPATTELEAVLLRLPHGSSRSACLLDLLERVRMPTPHPVPSGLQRGACLAGLVSMAFVREGTRAHLLRCYERIPLARGKQTRCAPRLFCPTLLKPRPRPLHPLPCTAYYLAACYLLPATCYLLPTTYHLFPTTC